MANRLTSTWKRKAVRVTAAFAACALFAGASAGCSTISGLLPFGDKDGIPAADGPHRVGADPTSRQATSGRDAATGPASSDTAGESHWVALGKKWVVPTGDPMEHLGNPTIDAIGTDGTRVFTAEAKISNKPPFHYPPGDLIAYDGATGKQLWKSTFQWAPNSVPVGAGNVVVLASAVSAPDRLDTLNGDTMDIVGLDSATGKELWRRNAAQPSGSVVDEHNVAAGVFLNGIFYYADGAMVYGLDPATGEVKLQHAYEGFKIASGPVVSGDLLALVAHPTWENEVTKQDQLMLLGPDFKDVATYSYPEEDQAPNCFSTLGKVVFNDGMFVSWSSRAVCAIQKTADNQLKLLWSKPLEHQIPSAAVSGVVPLFDFTNEPDSVVVGLDAMTGNELWRNEPPKGEDTVSRGGIAVVDGTLLSLGHHLQIIDPKTGKTTFDAKPGTKGGNYGGSALPVVAAGSIIMKRADGVWGFN
jgi:outer membrane protein assembly factor BamB